MKKIKTFFVRSLLLNKRLLKKLSFLLILCMIPLLTLSMAIFAKDDSGVLTITLCSEDKTDHTANAVINDLLNDDSVLKFIKVETVNEAYDSVKYGKADASWIFSENLQEKIDSFVAGAEIPFITVVERETDISLQLAHETLCGAVYPYVSRSLFKNYMLDNVFTEGEITSDEILKAYEEAIGGGSLVAFKTVDGADTPTSSNYLTAPLRGILSLVVVLCGLAAVMYHQTDRENRIYDLISPSMHIIPGIATTVAAILDSTVIIVTALAISGLFLSPVLEIFGALTFILTATAFCTLIGCITRKTTRTGQIIPFLMLICLVASPIFFDFYFLKPIQFMLPTYYYLYSIYQPIYLLYSLVYAAIAFGISFLINGITEK